MIKDRRTINVEIFEDTEKQCRTNDVLKSAIINSLSRQYIYKETEIVGAETVQRYAKTEVKVSGKRSFEAAREYKGKKICVHNFASATNPGGGVTRGASAQEECLCRCPETGRRLKPKHCWILPLSCEVILGKQSIGTNKLLCKITASPSKKCRELEIEL